MAKAILLHFTSKFNGNLTVFSKEMHSMSHFLSFSTEIFIFLFQLLFHTSLLHLFRPSFSFLCITKTIPCAKGNALEKSWVQKGTTTRIHPFQEQSRERPLSSGGSPAALLVALPTPMPMKNNQDFPVACHEALRQQGTSRECFKNLQVCAKWLWIAHVRESATQKDS